MKKEIVSNVDYIISRNNSQPKRNILRIYKNVYTYKCIYTLLVSSRWCIRRYRDMCMHMPVRVSLFFNIVKYMAKGREKNLSSIEITIRNIKITYVKKRHIMTL